MEIAKRSIDEAEIKLERYINLRMIKYCNACISLIHIGYETESGKWINPGYFYRLDYEHSKFLSSVSDEYNDDPERLVDEESKLLDRIKDQHDVIETARKVKLFKFPMDYVLFNVK
jgi:hypothetical protein